MANNEKHIYVKLAAYDSSGNEITDSSGNLAGNMVESSPGRIELFENTGVYIYEGFASFGTASSAAAWHIVRHTLSGTDITAVHRADGDGDYDNIWDNRASLSYS